MMTHKALVKKMLKQPAVKAAYDSQAEEFALLDEPLKARRQAGLTQAEVAARMGTKTPAVARGWRQAAAAGDTRRRWPRCANTRGPSAADWRFACGLTPGAGPAPNKPPAPKGRIA
jgi:hypothetical protein